MRTVDHAWIAEWMDTVTRGTTSMSQRAVTAIDRRGGIEPVVAAARARGIHLLQLTDDRGKLLVAASREPFTPLC